MMSRLYNSFRVLLVSFSYFFLLELALKKEYLPCPALALEYLFWLAVVLGIILLVWLIFTEKQLEASTGLWLAGLFFLSWFSYHRQEIASLGMKKFFTIFLPGIIFLTAFFLWIFLGLTSRLKSFRLPLLGGFLLSAPFWLLFYEQEGFKTYFQIPPRLNTFFLWLSFLFSGWILGIIFYFLSRLKLKFIFRLWLVFVLLVAIYAFSGSLLGEIKKSKSQPSVNSHLPDLFLITVDTLRADQLRVYSDRAPQTPNLDELAKDSLIFENAISPSNWTIPAIASWLTGRLPREHQAGKGIFDRGKETYNRLEESAYTLAEALKERGYYTCAFVDNPWLHPEMGFAQGFDYFFYKSPPSLRKYLLGIRLLRAGYQLFTKRFSYSGGAWMTQRVKSWLKNNSEKKPLFLWVHYFDPHLPYLKHPQTSLTVLAKPIIRRAVSRGRVELIRSGYYNLSLNDRLYIYELYQGEVVFTDLQVGEVINTIKELGRYRASVVIFTSDHGEEFWEHDSFEHGHTFYQELILVPLLVKLPQNKWAGKRISQPVSTLQIYSTFLEFAGAKTSQPPNLLISIEEPEKSLKYLVSEFPIYFSQKGAVISRDLKKIILGETEKKWFFDLKSDPEEKHPLPFSKTARDLEEKFSAPPSLAPLPAKPAPFSKEVIERLKSLGYFR